MEKGLHLADCLDGMKKIPDNSIEAIITDIPYALTSIQKRFGKEKSAPAKFGKDGSFSRLSGGFMNQSWDSDIPSLEIFKEMYRVLKKGAFFVTTFTTRQSNQMLLYQRLVEAGFNIEHTNLYWVFHSGFPKASSFSKMADKRMGAERESVGEDSHYGKAGFSIGIGGQTCQVCPHPSSKEAKTLEGWYSFSPKPSVELIIIAQKFHDEPTQIDCALKSIEDGEYAVGGACFGKCRIPYKNGEDINAEACPRLRQSNPKNVSLINIRGEYLPAQDGRFPSNLLVSDNILGVGDEQTKPANPTIGIHKANTQYGFGDSNGYRESRNIGDEGSPSRYYNIQAWFEVNVGKLPEETQKTYPLLQVPKPSSSEKNAGLRGENGSNTYNRKCLECGKWERKQGLSDDYICHCEEPNWEMARYIIKENITEEQKTKLKEIIPILNSETLIGKEEYDNLPEELKECFEVNSNFHPTAKSITLFSYLTRLFARENQIVLDPFAGSGASCCAWEVLKQPYIAFEREKDYYEIAKKRIEYWGKTKVERERIDRKTKEIKKGKELKEKGQRGLFD